MPNKNPPTLATIRIKNLRLRTYVGINEEEIQNQQDILVNVVIGYAADRAVQFNRIEEALNYRTITKEIIAHVESGRFALLERLTKELLEIVMNYEQVEVAEVEVDKPHALRFSDSVSVTLSARKEQP
ncbi:dihydroneopterin triphosphate 2'-epimerase [Marinospirillum insulare]|uniref:Dihydroneopterin triphosphate 2'-epimerase n=1 Tax=Marinospirillum insulare TaxID=217169 RepID=A0ABQ6A0I3_9GAMM|nr:dihydroneopterin triphosphate 2'-epimerase [Marinospirillum insulare]GLR64767.1 dihydroneopterin triphosphate 2'-epimerase [Marinospirillum insulare]